jgi:hypothetical protein
MIYLKKYNENKSNESTCEFITGYSEQELIDIFELNLEDNTEFDVFNVSVSVIPHSFLQSANSWGRVKAPRAAVIVSIVEDFGNNLGYLNIVKDNILKWSHPLTIEQQKSKNIYIESIRPMIKNINTKLLSVIGRKYDLMLNVIEVKINQSDNIRKNRYSIEFTVNKGDKV